MGNVVRSVDYNMASPLKRVRKSQGVAKELQSNYRNYQKKSVYMADPNRSKHLYANMKRL